MPNRSAEHKVVVNYNTQLTMLPIGTSALYLPDGKYLGVVTHTDGETTLVSDSGVYHCANTGLLSLDGVLRPYSMEAVTNRRTRIQSNIFANYVDWGDGTMEYGSNFHVYNSTFKTQHITIKGAARSYDYEGVEQRNITYIGLNDLGSDERTAIYDPYTDAVFIAIHPGVDTVENYTFSDTEYSHPRYLFELYLPESVQLIQRRWAYSDTVPHLGRVICMAQDPPTFEPGADTPMRSAQIFVPKEYLETYRMDTIWGDLDLYPLPQGDEYSGEIAWCHRYVGDLFKYPVKTPEDDTLFLSLYDRLLYIPEGKHKVFFDYYDSGTIERNGTICTWTMPAGDQYSADVSYNFDLNKYMRGIRMNILVTQPNTTVKLKEYDATRGWRYETVDWGDGMSSSYTPNAEHNYTEPGYYHLWFRRMTQYPPLQYFCYSDDTPYDKIIEFYMYDGEGYKTDFGDIPFLGGTAVQTVWLNGADWALCNSPTYLAESVENLILPSSIVQLDCSADGGSGYHPECQSIVLPNITGPVYIDNDVFDHYPNAHIFGSSSQFTVTMQSYSDIDDNVLQSHFCYDTPMEAAELLHHPAHGFVDRVRCNGDKNWTIYGLSIHAAQNDQWLRFITMQLHAGGAAANIPAHSTVALHWFEEDNTFPDGTIIPLTAISANGGAPLSSIVFFIQDGVLYAQNQSTMSCEVRLYDFYLSGICYA